MLGDMGTPHTQTVVADGATSMFDMSLAPIEPRSVVVVTSTDGINWSAPLTQGTDYNVDSFNGRLLFPTSPPSGTIIAASMIGYQDWTDTDLLDFIQIAFLQHTYHRDPHVYLDAVPGAVPPTQVLPPVEENLVAILAVVESYWALATAKSQNFTIDTGDGTVIPLPQQYDHILGHISQLMDRYERQARMLNVGMYAIEMLTLRRVSRITGCLVPVYRDQELEERWWVPERVLPPIPVLGDIRIRYRGIWNPNDTYFINDEVVEGGITYVALAENQDVEPALDVLNGNGFVGLNWKQTYINTIEGFWQGYSW